MKIGVVYPQTEYGHDPIAIRDYAQTAEALGFSHILAYEHVLGANPDRPEGWMGPYTYLHPFIEPFVLFGFMAAHTRTIEFATGVVILPQRQTALIAKQAASLDVLSQGRLRLGIGLGWNPVEYISLNQDFHNRGKRIEEQVDLLRQLWTQPLVNFSGRWHTIPDAGINPLPVQKPIPIWFGGHAEAVIQRIARIGDGWMLNYKTPLEAAPGLELLDRYLAENRRNKEDIGVEARFSYGNGEVAQWQAIVQGWQSAGATHLSLNTMACGFQKPDEHLKALQGFAQEIDLT